MFLKFLLQFDVLQEYLKPVFASGEPKAIKAAQSTLYRALEVGLRLLSPFMPYITEELYQRLPRPMSERKNIPSICVAPYPQTEDLHWKNETIENEVEFIQKIARAIRSARSDYNLPNKTKTEGKFFIHITNVSIFHFDFSLSPMQ